jgi:3-methyl-2-oxobutanoate hydroxymethyltransferase
MAKVTIATLQQMKRDKQKIVAAVAYEYQMAQLLDRAGVDIVSVGDSLGYAFFGQATHYEVSVEQMILCCLAVTRGVQRAAVNCDLPFGTIQAGPDEAVRAAIRLVKEGHAEMVKPDGAVDYLECVRAIARAGIPVFAQMGFTPQTSIGIGGFEQRTEAMLAERRSQLVRDAKLLEDAGASLLDVTNVGNEIVGEIAEAVRIPVIGGHNTGPLADGRVTVSYSLVGYRVNALDRQDGAPSVAKMVLDTMTRYVADVRAGQAPP